MASTVRDICQDALVEVGAIAPGESIPAQFSNLVLLRFQHQLDAWQAESLTLAVNTPLSFTILSGVSTFTIGPASATPDIAAQRPVWIEAMTYLVPGSSPPVETIMAPMSDDQYDVLSIKTLSSSLPTEYYYNTSFTTLLGSIFVWPTPSQDVDVRIYVKQGAAVPVTLNDTVLGPPGYAEAFLYQLAERLLTPLSVADANVVQRVLRMSQLALARIKRANLNPGLLGVDAALTPSSGGAYNILNDTNTGYYGGG